MRLPMLATVFTAAAFAGPLLLPTPVALRPLVTTLGDPASYVVTSPSPYDGVARLVIQTSAGLFGCSGALVTSRHLVTAAHCLTDDFGNLDVLSLTAAFPTAGVFSGAGYAVHPGWTGDLAGGYDIAIVRLSASTGLSGYPIETGLVFGQVDVAGYGLSGSGSTGWTLPFGTLRAGTNMFEPIAWNYPGLPYAYDFDDGTEQRDALCILLGSNFCGTYTSREVHPAPGDSGGPSFWNGRLIAIHSFIATFGPEFGDLDSELNGTFGELAGDTRLGPYADWIQSQIPEPSTAALLCLGLVAIACFSRRRRA